ncbi:polyprenyl synthetase family protein [Caloranaerobacter azorensis]|uniref:Farnesyl diphosphate synthase n=3 Tax=Caloranaerobacter azorensis TaxID=116090 RepID=A0A1M5VN40_9FIRM|nr:farnesyl diphosphate synthase [Caloranaerobacter azorensis]KGG81418.1 farnesyl-diphosphate synthase [Caloranaerobacter azorensis H53214]QIB26017.1 polyprenyl synthetase family protein [Caloranaerobacter azorensis]SHH76672.1 farnesyl-diphosphate synthase [Caloranaerobacter azorensis DSM 13643]
MKLKQELEKYKNIIDKELDKILPNYNTPQKKIFEAMRYSIFAGGKRLRPILVLKTCELVGGKYSDAINFALSIEMIHTYSLIHDDLPAMDNDDYRRGKLTNHKVFGEGIAVLAGDGLLNLAFETMINDIINDIDKSERKIKALKVIAESAGVFGMIGGQVVDIISEGRNIDENTLLYIHEKKTSALIEASILSGAIIGGASSDELERLSTYARAIGIGYQIRDDILDRIGDSEKLGKRVGSDEENNKVTYLSFYEIEDAIRETERLCKSAIMALDSFDKEKVKFFEELANYLVYREN